MTRLFHAKGGFYFDLQWSRHEIDFVTALSLGLVTLRKAEFDDEDRLKLEILVEMWEWNLVVRITT